jgi:hypothetical protein
LWTGENQTPLKRFSIAVQSGDMLFRGQHTVKTPDVRTSDLLDERIQRIEAERAALRAKIESERQLRFLTAEIVGAAQAAPLIGHAIEHFAQVMRAPSILADALAASLALQVRGAISTVLSCRNRRDLKRTAKITSDTLRAGAQGRQSRIALRTELLFEGALRNMSDEWPKEFIEQLEEAISLCASRFNISQQQKIELECALERVFGKSFLLGYATHKR